MINKILTLTIISLVSASALAQTSELSENKKVFIETSSTMPKNKEVVYEHPDDIKAEEIANEQNIKKEEDKKVYKAIYLKLKNSYPYASKEELMPLLNEQWYKNRQLNQYNEAYENYKKHREL